MKNNIIAFTGLMGSGKSTSAGIMSSILLQRGYKPVVVKFADPLYKIMHSICDTTHIDFNKPKLRPVMQFLGSYFRNTYNQDFWVNLWEMEVKHLTFFNKQNDNLVFLVDDLRYENEAKKILELGGKIIKTDCEEATRRSRIEIVNEGHESEKGVCLKYVHATVYTDKAIADSTKNLSYILDLLGLHAKEIQS